ncbi:hypothetical protein DFS33DRAFT_1380973 [Desarmillaria ectypa]|nr:hypothetical protein DFS33DRAFT_1380973 [Desarmillaria ectypa]
MSFGVTTDLFFMQPLINSKWAYITNDAGPAGKNNRNYSLEPKTVTVENYRTNWIWNLSLSTLLDSTSSRIISCSPSKIGRVLIYDYTIRCHHPGESGDSPDNYQPVAITDVDQTFKAAITRIHRHLPPEDVPRLLVKHLQIQDLEKDIEPIDLIYTDRKGETFSLKYNERQRWNYFKNIRPDEFVLIKCNESVQDRSVALYTLHTAFADPTTLEGTPFRQSIEIGALVFYD